MELPVAFTTNESGIVLLTYATADMWDALAPGPKVGDLSMEEIAIHAAIDISDIPTWWYQGPECTLTSHEGDCACGPLASISQVLEKVSPEYWNDVEVCQVHLLGVLRRHWGSVGAWLMEEGDIEFNYCLGCVLYPTLHAEVLQGFLEEARSGVLELQKRIGEVF